PTITFNTQKIISCLYIFDVHNSGIKSTNSLVIEIYKGHICKNLGILNNKNISKNALNTPIIISKLHIPHFNNGRTLTRNTSRGGKVNGYTAPVSPNTIDLDPFTRNCINTGPKFINRYI